MNPERTKFLPVQEIMSPFFEKERQPNKIILEVLSHFLIPRKIQIHHIENLEEAIELSKQGKELVVCPNHNSNADSPVLARGLRKNGFKGFEDHLVHIQGAKLDRHPINKFFTHGLKVIKIWPESLTARTDEEKKKKKEMNDKAQKYATECLREGYHLVLYLEGGRSYSGSLKQAERTGVAYFRLVKDSETMVLPVGIIDADKVMPPGKILILPNPSLVVNIVFGKPINASSLIEKNSHLSDHRMRRAVIDEIMKNGIAPCLPPERRGVYA